MVEHKNAEVWRKCVGKFVIIFIEMHYLFCAQSASSCLLFLFSVTLKFDFWQVATDPVATLQTSTYSFWLIQGRTF